MINLFDSVDTDFLFILEQRGRDVWINKGRVKALITNTALEQNYDDKRITTLTPIKRGDLVEMGSSTFMVVSEVSEQRYGKFKAVMRKLPLKVIINSSCQFITLKAYSQVKNWGVSGGQVITLPDGTIELVTSNAALELAPKIGDRFLLQGVAYKIVNIDTYSRVGEMILGCKKDLINDAIDDLDNGIAGVGSCGIKITNTNDTITIGDKLQLIYDAPEIPLKFKSSDPTVATINTNGLITAHKEGETSITVSNASYDGIRDTKAFTVSATAPELVVSGKDIIYVKSSESYISNQAVVWSIYADDKTNTTTLASITSQDDKSCTIRAGDKVGYVQLKATSKSDPSVFMYKRIQIKSLY